jgi:hypothetical protein
MKNVLCTLRHTARRATRAAWTYAAAQRLTIAARMLLG